MKDTDLALRSLESSWDGKDAQRITTPQDKEAHTTDTG